MASESSIEVRTTESGAVQRTLEVQVPAPRVKKAFDRAYKNLARSVRVKGFRPGKAPRSVLERLYGASVAEELERTLVAESLEDAVERSGIVPVSEPAIEAEPPSLGAAFQYKVTLEVKPEIELPETKGLPATRPGVEVTEAEILIELDTLRERNAPLVEEPEDTLIARGHVAVIDFEGTVDGEAFEGGAGQGVAVEIGAERFPPGFEEQLEGAVAGEDRTVKVTLPDDHAREDLAGREADFAVHVLTVKRREIPDLDDDFAKDLSDEFESLDDLKNRVREDMERTRERTARRELRRTLMDALIKRTSFDVPPGMLERQLERRLAMAHRQLEGSVPEATLHGQLASWREEWRGGAEREVRETLLLEAVARDRELEASEEEIEQRLDEMAKEQDVPKQRLRNAYQEEGLLDALAHQIVDDKALDALIAEAKVEETTGT